MFHQFVSEGLRRHTANEPDIFVKNIIKLLTQNM